MELVGLSRGNRFIDQLIQIFVVFGFNTEDIAQLVPFRFPDVGSVGGRPVLLSRWS
jgi:hypothetical protein